MVYGGGGGCYCCACAFAISGKYLHTHDHFHECRQARKMGEIKCLNTQQKMSEGHNYNNWHLEDLLNERTTVCNN